MRLLPMAFELPPSPCCARSLAHKVRRGVPPPLEHVLEAAAPTIVAVGILLDHPTERGRDRIKRAGLQTLLALLARERKWKTCLPSSGFLSMIFRLRALPPS